MEHLTLRSIRQGLKNKQFSAVEICQHYLKKIKAQKELNAFISWDETHSLAAAKQVDDQIHSGLIPRLGGVPLAVKDLFCSLHLPTTCASKMLVDYQSPFEATVLKNLRQAGAVVIGKTNMDEFAMGSANENSYFGPVKNPWDPSRVSGGSSGGSAVAVAAGLAPLALGSDTGGSIRQPAAFCGVSGIKPTYGLASRYGMVAYASSLDQAGLFAHDIADLAEGLEAMLGHDPMDSTSINRPIPDFPALLEQKPKPLRLGLPRAFFDENVDSAIRDSLRKAVDFYSNQGAEIIELDWKYLNLWVPCYYVIACAEASSNLSRFDGVRYGLRAKDPKSLSDMIIKTRDQGFGLEVKRRIMTGTHVLSAGYYDAYYLQALKIRRLIQQELLSSLNKVDAIMGPTTPSLPFKLGEKLNDPIQNYLADIFTVAANLAGLPALSIPIGFSQGLPIGMQLMGSHFSEASLMTIAHSYQQATDWHKARPTLQE